MQNFLNLTGNYRLISSKVLVVFCFGISSGIPFLLILSTLSVWLTEQGISKVVIGLMALATLPYTLKFVWPPLLYAYKIPIVTDYLGHNRGWLLIIQILLLLSIISLSFTNPSENIVVVFCCALLVGILSSCQDVLVEGYRIDALENDISSYGASASVVGYRIGMLLGSSGALYISAIASWHTAYLSVACCLALGIVATLYANEPHVNRLAVQKLSKIRSVVSPLKKLLADLDYKFLILFIISFKSFDSIFNAMSMPLLLELGFDKIAIASVAKSFGIFAMIFGGIAGGVLLQRLGLVSFFKICLLMQIISSLICILQVTLGNNHLALFFTIGIENCTSGLSQVALVYYLTLISKGKHSAFTFAVLTSIASLARVLISILAGYLAETFSWTHYFLISILLIIPAIYILYANIQHFMHIGQKKLYKSPVLDDENLHVISHKR